MTTHAELMKQIADLQKQADHLQSSERKGAIDQVNSLVAQFGIKVSEVRFNVKSGANRKTSSVAVKYRDSSGNTWTGRGRTPRWLAEAETHGKRRESFLVG